MSSCRYAKTRGECPEPHYTWAVRLLHGFLYAADCQHVVGRSRRCGNAALLKLTGDHTAAALNDALLLWLIRIMDLYVAIIDFAELESECFLVGR